MIDLFDKVSAKTSKLVTNEYSTSFSLGIRFLNQDFRDPIYAIYGFVRFADEIVDTLHHFNKKELLAEYEKETYLAIDRGISLNPILNSFQKVVNTYKIDRWLIETFLKSMAMDLEKTSYDANGYKEYIVGSAEVVGLMCLKIFVRGNQLAYDALKDDAMALGSAFQKINFLRDFHADYLGMGRIYFPGLTIEKLDAKTKAAIEADIALDFEKGLNGIKRLPKDARFGVYVAYIYYRTLFNKIKKLHPEKILEKRVRIPNSQKVVLFAGSYLRNSINLL